MDELKTGIDNARRYLRVAEQEVERIWQDMYLSDQGKREKAERVRNSAADLAGVEIRAYLDTLGAAEKRARRSLDSIQAQHDVVDRDAERFAMERIAPIAEYGDWEEISAVVQDAITKQDAPRLRALALVAPQVRQRFNGDHRYSMDAGTMGKDVKRALAAMEPAELLEARQRHQGAIDAMMTAEARLSNLKFEFRAIPTGWLDEVIYGRPQVVQETDDAGNVVAFSHVGGRGPFG